MAKKTVLAMVQDILSDMESDEVNSISDTTEALQVAQIIQATYEDLMLRKYQPHLRTLFSLDATNASTPTYLKLPTDVMEIETLSYDKKKSGATNSKFLGLIYREPDDFLRVSNALDSDESTVDEITGIAGLVIKIRNDIAPTYWTSFDDEYVICDSYDSTLEANLQSSKTQLLGYKEPSLTLADATVPDLPSEVFPFLLSEAKKHCLAKLKQVTATDTSYIEEIKRNRRQNTWLQRKKWRTKKQSKYPNYGRS